MLYVFNKIRENLHFNVNWGNPVYRMLMVDLFILIILLITIAIHYA